MRQQTDHSSFCLRTRLNTKMGTIYFVLITILNGPSLLNLKTTPWLICKFYFQNMVFLILWYQQRPNAQLRHSPTSQEAMYLFKRSAALNLQKVIDSQNAPYIHSTEFRERLIKLKPQDESLPVNQLKGKRDSSCEQNCHQNQCSSYISFVTLMHNIILLTIDIHEEIKTC